MMIIEQFENQHLAHFSYAILSECERKIVLIDPSRDPHAYYDFAQKHQAGIIAVIETHPHADFISSHLEISRATGAAIYASAFAGAQYPHIPFDETAVLSFGKIRLRALNTPGHSPDSICIVLEREEKDMAVFTGDTLFIGDCGRPDLRETAGKNSAGREDLAKAMYNSLRQRLKPLADDVLVYPAHGAGSLCGKSLKKEKVSTMGEEKITNWSMQDMTESDFIEQLLSDQPFIPPYFGYDVDLNLAGAPDFSQCVRRVPIIQQPDETTSGIMVIDTRDEKLFKLGHLPRSINLMTGHPFETWLGTLVEPHQPYYLAAGDTATLQTMIERTASIGYEKFIAAAFVLEKAKETMPPLDDEQFRRHPDHFTIVDVRNETEAKDKTIFSDSIHLPLSTLKQRWKDIPLHKPIVVHCAGGYRSAAASSLLFEKLKDNVKIYDLGEAIKDFI
jgi:hydroxyacylglutathione hydrolase